MGELRIPPPRGYVNDFANSLSRSQAAQLEQLCRHIDRETGAQVALVILTSLEGEPIDEVRNRLFEAWGVGRAANDRGLLIMHALQERRIEVETGYGLEGVLPDARVGAILDEAVMPHLRSGDFYAGYQSGLLQFGRHLAADSSASSGQDAYRSTGRTASGQRSESGGFPWGALLLAPLFLYLAIRHPRLLLLMLIMGGGRRSGGMGGGFGGGFGGFGGGGSGGGGAGRGY
jgi:uncharacterized protein